jgi:dihydrofolate synthase / folylpolyglutamate synthase
MDYKQTLKYLYEQLPMFHRIGPAAYKANLDNTYAISAHLKHPEKAFKSIHIAGTNGKGSVSHLLASILIKAGYKTGLYTSPHLKDFRERVTINGKMISKEYLIRFVEENKTEFEKIQPSFFEWTVGLAFDNFRNEKVDFAVLETGLGGRLDSTNIVSPEISIITGISLDHTNLLGDTLEKIAVEKAGIIKEKIPVVIGRTDPQTDHVFLKKAKETGSEIIFADQNFSAEWKDNADVRQVHVKAKNGKELWLKMPLAGDYQKQNLQTVMQSVETLQKHEIHISDEDIAEGVEEVVKLTHLRGRWEKLSETPLTFCDVGHNEEGILEVVKMIKATPHKKLHFVLGMMKDKDHRNILKHLPKEAIYYFCQPDIPRAMPAHELKELAETCNLIGNVFSSVAEAYNAARFEAGKADLVFVGGSTFVVAEVI